MSDPNASRKMIERIQQLWDELDKMNPRSVEYETTMGKIRDLVAKYRAHVEASENPKGSK